MQVNLYSDLRGRHDKSSKKKKAGADLNIYKPKQIEEVIKCCEVLIISSANHKLKLLIQHLPNG